MDLYGVGTRSSHERMIYKNQRDFQVGMVARNAQNPRRKTVDTRAVAVREFGTSGGRLPAGRNGVRKRRMRYRYE